MMRNCGGGGSSSSSSLHTCSSRSLTSTIFDEEDVDGGDKSIPTNEVLDFKLLPFCNENIQNRDSV